MGKKFSWAMADVPEPFKGHHHVSPGGKNPTLARPPKMSDATAQFLGTQNAWDMWYDTETGMVYFVSRDRTIEKALSVLMAESNTASSPEGVAKQVLTTLRYIMPKEG